MSKTRSRSATGEGGTVAKRAARDDDSVGDDRPRQPNRKISQDARSRMFVQDRNRSIEDYSRFAATAGLDLFNGEPLEIFAGVVKVDNVLLRKEAHALRKEVLRLRAAEVMEPQRIEA